MTPILLVTGTDTGVGKTAISVALIRTLFVRGIKVFPLKPVETGCARVDGELFPSDGDKLYRAARLTGPLSAVSPLRFELPLAPFAASQIEGRPVVIAEILEHARHAAENTDLLLIEGAGGLLVPLTEDYSFVQLARDLSAQVLVVVGSKLGCINHALMTFDVLQRHGLPVLGYVLNDLFQNEAQLSGDTSVATNRQIISRLATQRYGIPELDYVPYQADGAEKIEVKQLATITMNQLRKNPLFSLQ